VRQAPKLTVSQWNGLVERLNDSSTRKQAFLMRAQHAQIASELAGLTFTPHISGKSRELAAHNKSLPQRMEALMRKKKAKLEKIRHDRVQKEMAEATFKPDLEKSRASVKTTGLAGAAAVRERRQIGHLLQYVSGRGQRGQGGGGGMLDGAVLLTVCPRACGAGRARRSWTSASARRSGGSSSPRWRTGS
jgi:hypothetical protein